MGMRVSWHRKGLSGKRDSICKDGIMEDQSNLWHSSFRGAMNVRIKWWDWKSRQGPSIGRPWCHDKEFESYEELLIFLSKWKTSNLHFRKILLRSVWRVVLTLNSRLYSGMKLEVDLRRVQKVVIVGQIRNEGLTWKIEVGIKKGEWIRKTSSLGWYLSVQG